MDPVSDQLSIDTPELVSIDMPLAGIGSRFVAVLIDTVLWTVALILLSIAFAVVAPAIHAFNKL